MSGAAGNCSLRSNAETVYTGAGGTHYRKIRSEDSGDLRKVWKRIRKDPAANLEFAALNLLSCAEEMTGRIDFCGFTPGELKLILSRYNGRVKQITDYGEEAYGHYLRYNRQP